MHGFSNYPYVVIPAPFIEGVMIPGEMWEQKVQDATLKAEELLTGRIV